MTATFGRAVLVVLFASLVAAAALAGREERVALVPVRSIPPAGGHHSRVGLGDSIVRLVRAGVIDPKKFEAVYGSRGGTPPGLKDLLTKSSFGPILLAPANAGIYVNLLWPVGLANHMGANDASPLNGPSLMNFASTGGWNLGRARNGGDYFSKFAIVDLTRKQEELVVSVARHLFRPCCDNSAFFQDCNHGSALLGLLALGAAQGLNEEQLYREALAFNAAWFPDHYRQTALYFKTVKHLDLEQADARLVMSAEYSSASGWIKNVAGELSALGLTPSRTDTSCGA
jgi:hypothetical protein